MQNEIKQQPDVIIEAANLQLGYAQKVIIRDFTARIHTGEFVAVLGPNGAGKSTLLKAILGLIQPYAGHLTVLGDQPRQGNPAIGYMPQMRTPPVFVLSGRALIAATYQGYCWGLPLLKPSIKAEIEKVIKAVEAEAYADRPFYQLSGGERQRLLLAQALLEQPKILLLDEPLSNLDPRYQGSLIELVHHLCRQLKITVLFTAHDVNPLMGVMDRVLYLAEGNAAIGTVDEVINSKRLTALYGTPIEVIRHQERVFVVSQEQGIYDHGIHCHPDQ